MLTKKNKFGKPKAAIWRYFKSSLLLIFIESLHLKAYPPVLNGKKKEKKKLSK